MKKILTVSLFAMMAVSAANAEIASTDYVGKQLQPYSTTAQMEAYVSGELAVVNGNNTALSGRVDTLESVVTAEGGVQDAVDAIEEALAEDGATGKAIADNAAAISAMDAAYKAADTATLDSAKSYADGLAVNYDSKGSAAQALTDAKAYTDDEIEALETSLGTTSGDLTALTTRVGTAEGKITTIEGQQTTQDGKISALETSLSATGTTGKAIADNAAAISAMDAAYKAADTATLDSAKSYADGLASNYDAAGSAAAAQTAAVSAAKTAADATYQVKSSALSVGAADGAWNDLTKATGYSTTGTHSLVLKNGTIQWEAVSY